MFKSASKYKVNHTRLLLKTTVYILKIAYVLSADFVQVFIDVFGEILDYTLSIISVGKILS